MANVCTQPPWGQPLPTAALCGAFAPACILYKDSYFPGVFRAPNLCDVLCILYKQNQKSGALRAPDLYGVSLCFVSISNKRVGWSPLGQLSTGQKF